MLTVIVKTEGTITIPWYRQILREAHITLFRGDYGKIILALYENKTPVNLEGFSGYFTLKYKETDINNVLQIPIIIEEDSLGQLSVELLPQATANLLPTTYYFDIELANADRSRVYTILWGTFSLLYDIT